MNRLKTKDDRLRTRKLRAWIFFGLWSSVFGLFSAQGAERIVSLNACTDELLLQLAKPRQIAGVTNFSHTPLSEAVLAAHPEIPKFASNIEKILEAKPELVLAGPFSSQLILNQLRRADVPVSVLDIPRNWEELLQSARQIVGNKQPELEKQIQQLEVLRTHSKWRGKAAVFWSAAGHVSGRDTFENTILRTLGMTNRADFEGYAFLSLEKLIQLRPDVIVVTQDPQKKDSWAHDTLFHPALRAALPHLEYVMVPETAASCASGYTVQVLENLLTGAA